MKKLFLFLASVAWLPAQGLDPSELFKLPTSTWPTYNGDYSGRRYSTLSRINKENAAALTLAWAFQTHSVAIKSTPLEVNGILYFTVPDHVWAIDARTGQQVWHYQRPSEGDKIGQRGVAMYKGRVYFGTPDAHLICLDARNGKQIWDIQVADVAFGYYVSVAPLVVKDRLIIGTSGDSADVAHFVEAIDPEDGRVLWRWDTIPKPGEAGSETWPNKEAMSHGGGAAWLTGTYDPKLNLLYWGTGNPHPVLSGVTRPGDNLYTCAIVALNPDTGKLVWYFQASPHDTHDWDAVETPVLIDVDFQGKPRKLLAQASRNGYFFVLDRATGESLLSTPFVKVDWAVRVDVKGSPIPDRRKEPQPDGSLIASAIYGATNWMAPSFDPDTNLFYVNATTGSCLLYLTLNDQDKPQGHQGGNENALWVESELVALDYETGQAKWRRNGGNAISFPGILTTAGQLLFTGDALGNLLALDPVTGITLWHVHAGGNLTNSPMTYELDNRQYVLTGVDSVLYAWSLPGN